MPDMSYGSMSAQNKQAVQDISVIKADGSIQVQLPASIIQVRDLHLNSSVQIGQADQSAFFHNQKYFGTQAAQQVASLGFACSNCAQSYIVNSEPGLLEHMKLLQHALNKVCLEIIGAW